MFRDLEDDMSLPPEQLFQLYGNDVKLIKNLQVIQNELQTKRWIASESMEDMRQNTQLMMPKAIAECVTLLDEMTEENDYCYVATKVYRTFVRLIGKLFQGIASLIIP